ncbi:AAA family ATPase [Nostoc sp. FACHB-87]|nr:MULTISPECIES: AAA family ATPase [Nostocaceae]MBD2453967.1 AAA family ATPase [Nostoc sp. FACHB-87]MBD2476092.1 AAA family ATPase [Anabaena sp. FACHB-83]MBD2489759.1 AAA family ATPase [Aulosira sp. FACHB-615]
MFLQRIRVPDFRVLKNVDISFEKEFTPSIFPLGSLNGGGKSTLLQLIFVLLHCSIHEDRKIFLKNLIEGFKIDKDSDKRVLAIIDIWDGKQNIELEFFTCKESFVLDTYEQENNDSEISENNLSGKDVYDDIKKNQSEYSLGKTFYLLYEKKHRQEYFHRIFSKYLQSNKTGYICDVYTDNVDSSKEMLLCRFDNLEINDVESFLINLSEKVFLAAHISQIFLFLSANSRKSLFNNQSENDYYLGLKQDKTKLPNFFTYDFMAIDILIKSFTDARDQDFRQAIETGGYGDNYKTLLKDLNSVLNNKKININKDLSGVNFKRDDDDVELYPEDLSHGELKKLCIYVWIKSNKIENAIVLMDEIEIAFHPDWQYQIVRDLEEWSPSNQYILATHSYELCQAVTPAHVKELPPKLIKPNKL